MDAQTYCSVKEMLQELAATGIDGDRQDKLLSKLETASQFIAQHLGIFIPIQETRVKKASDKNSIRIGACLSITSVTEDSVVIADYTTDPAEKCYRNGPFTDLIRDDDAIWAEDLTILGLWGLYLKVKALGISVSQLIGDTTIVATKGSVLSPGMTVLIGSEQEYILEGNGGPGSPAATIAVSQLNGAVLDTDELITVDNGAEFFAEEVIRIEAEDIYIQKMAGHVAITSRGWNGTTKADHANDSPIYVYRTYNVERGVNGTTAAAHVTAAVSRYLPPADIQWLCVQMAALMLQKGETGFGGRAGNAETGETFFVNEFPQQQIAKIKENYSIKWI